MGPCGTKDCMWRKTTEHTEHTEKDCMWKETTKYTKYTKRRYAQDCMWRKPEGYAPEHNVLGNTQKKDCMWEKGLCPSLSLCLI